MSHNPELEAIPSELALNHPPPSSSQVLDVSHNPELEAIPSEVGWLPLTRLELGNSPRLRMPEIVIERGFR